MYRENLLTDKHDGLARRWKRGDPGAALEAHRLFARPMAAVAWNITRDASLAEDVVQESFARAATAVRRLKDEDALGAFMLNIARNVARDQVRGRSRETPLGSSAERFEARGDTPERAELRESLRRAVDSLPEDQRELFLMKYTSGLGYREIALALGTTPDAVGQKLWRIRKKLRNELKDLHP